MISENMPQTSDIISIFLEKILSLGQNIYSCLRHSNLQHFKNFSLVNDNSPPYTHTCCHHTWRISKKKEMRMYKTIVNYNFARQFSRKKNIYSINRIFVLWHKSLYGAKFSGLVPLLLDIEFENSDQKWPAPTWLNINNTF